jgi:hypothetical protein
VIGLSYDEVTAGPQPVAPSSMSRFGDQRLYRDAGAMAVSSVANAVLGIVFWAFAARLFAPEQLGVMTAVLAVITSAGLVAASGWATRTPRFCRPRGVSGETVRARATDLYILAPTLGIGAAIGTTLLLAEVRGSIGVALLVVVGIAAWAGITLQNATLVALGRANWLPATNIAASLGKIHLAAATGRYAPDGIPSSSQSFVAAAAVVVVLQPFVGRMIRAQHDSTNAEVPEERLARSFNAFVSQTIFAAVLSLGAITLTPFVVTAFAGRGKEPCSRSRCQLFRRWISSERHSPLRSPCMPRERLTMQGQWQKRCPARALALEAIGAVVIIAVAPLGLQVLNSQYGAMNPTEVIAILCGASLMRAAYLIWAGLERARRNVTVPLVLNCVFTAILLLATPVMSGRFGALGGASAVLLAQSVLTLGAAFHVLSRQLKLRRSAKRNLERRALYTNEHDVAALSTAIGRVASCQRCPLRWVPLAESTYRQSIV